jgi:predicted O-methyltransferase YrrM
MDENIISLNTPYGLGERNYSLIKNFLDEKKIKNILEFGSGSSTVRLGKDYPNSKITSIEQDQKYFNKTRSLLNEHGINNAEVIHTPLKVLRLDMLRIYLTYDLRNNEWKHNFDVVLIDGPVERQTVRGREGVLYQIFSNINKNGIIILDDYHRESSARTVQNWINTYPDQLRIVKEHENIVILKKEVSNTSYHYPGFLSLVDNWKSAIYMLKRNRKQLSNFF